MTSPSDDRPGGSTPGLVRYFDGQRSKPHAVVLSLDADRLRISGDGIARDEPLDAIVLSERIGATPRFVRFPDGAFCEVTDQAALHPLLDRQPARGEWLPRLEDSPGLALTALVLLALATLGGYIYGLPLMAASAANQLPPSALETLSQQTLNTLDQFVLEPSRLLAAKPMVVRARLSHLRLPENVRIRVEFRRSQTIGANAFALPSGVVVVTDDLVNLAQNPDEVVAVLAHEAGHVAGRHGLRQIIEHSVVSVLMTWYVGDISALAAAAPTALLQARYSRDLEREADAFAIDALKASGMSPARLADILERLGQQRGLGASPAFAYLSSHPATAERVERLRRSAQ